MRRERDAKDRRRVVVHLDAGEGPGTTWPACSRRWSRDWQELAADYTDDELRLIVGFYGQMEQVIRDHLVRLRGDT